MAFLDDEHKRQYLEFHKIPPERAEEAWAQKVALHQRKHEVPGLIADIAPWDAYVSPASGKPITSRKERREDMLRTESRPWEGFEAERKEADRWKAEQERKQDAKLHEAASRAFYQLDPKKRRTLTQG